MKIGFVQFNCQFANKQENLNKVISEIEKNKAELWVLPELFNTGYLFSEIDELENLSEEIPNGETTEALIQLSGKYNTTIVAGIAEHENDKFYNSAIIVSRNKFIGKYRKLHLFDREKLWFEQGNLPLDVYELDNYKIGVMICFDWFFPETARTLTLKGAEIICHPSNLVMPYCQSAMATRCLENHIFAITANRIGEEKKDGLQLKFTGRSQIVSPKGKILIQADINTEEVRIVDIDPKQAQNKNINNVNNIINDRRKDFYFT